MTMTNDYDIITMIMMPWQQLLWYHNNDQDVMMSMIRMLWQKLWCHDSNYDIITMIMMTWQQLVWYHNNYYEIIMIMIRVLWRHDNDSNVMTVIMISWQWSIYLYIYLCDFTVQLTFSKCTLSICQLAICYNNKNTIKNMPTKNKETRIFLSKNNCSCENIR